LSGKREIAAEVIKRMDGSVTKKDIERIVTLTFAIINDMTKKGERVSVRGFGSFEVVERREKKGRDPPNRRGHHHVRPQEAGAEDQT